MLIASEALSRLREGNRRFAANAASGGAPPVESAPAELVAEAEPFAIVLCCSDPRVAPEIVFDQGLGDLFVVRVAGNVAGPTQVGSVELAVSALHTRLVVVLGHSQCRAVETALDRLDGPLPGESANLTEILDPIRWAIAPLVTADETAEAERIVGRAVQANVAASVTKLRRSEALIATNSLHIVGAQYSVETGVVEFFDEIEAGR